MEFCWLLRWRFCRPAYGRSTEAPQDTQQWVTPPEWAGLQFTRRLEALLLVPSGLLSLVSAGR